MTIACLLAKAIAAPVPGLRHATHPVTPPTFIDWNLAMIWIQKLSTQAIRRFIASKGLAHPRARHDA
jgi:hypothetical protein